MFQLSDIRQLRLQNQQILAPRESEAPRIVSQMLAMQAQDYAMVKWAIGLRSKGIVESDVESAFQSGTILRTHLLRPTWHFVAPADIRWLLKLTALQVHKKNASMYRKTGLDAETLRRSCLILERALSGKQLTREQLSEILLQEGISAAGHRLGYIMMNAELEGVVCSGGRIGKHFSYALLDDLVPPDTSFVREEALARLAERYFTSRGPATARDFSYWSGLSMADARKGVACLGKDFTKASLGGDDYYYVEPPFRVPLDQRATFLLPDYDECGMSYKNREAMRPKKNPAEQPSDFSHWLVVRGRIAGTWQFTKGVRGDARVIPSYDPTEEEQEELSAALERYRAFWSSNNSKR